jgi:AraC-like DNA-binding protein
MTALNDLDTGRMARSRPLPSDVKKALAYLRQAGARKPSIGDLVSYCAVPERTLQKHFRAFMGVSPLDYWRRLRLAEARNELLRCAERYLRHRNRHASRLQSPRKVCAAISPPFRRNTVEHVAAEPACETCGTCNSSPGGGEILSHRGDNAHLA